MLAAYTPLKKAQKVKQILLKKNILHPEFLPVKEMGYIYFPIIKRIKLSHSKIVNTKFSFPQKETKSTVDDLLKKKLTAKQFQLLPRSQEMVGKILILDIPKELKNKEKLIAEAYLKTNQNIATVVKKVRIHSGLYRLRKVKILAGKKTKETVHYENGVNIKLHLEKTYFSARSANERLRIAKQVKKNEQVLVMFSGAAPYLLVLARNSPAKTISGIEINPAAHQFAVENITSNNFHNKINLFQGDVKTVLPKINQKFDRIVMPLPKIGEQFLSTALKKTKKGSIIHFYDFLNENEFVNQAQKIKEICHQNKKLVRILRKVKCGQFSPGVFRVCFDLKIL